MRRARLIALCLGSIASACAAACSLIVGDETISGRVVDAGSGGSGGSTTSTSSGGSGGCVKKVLWSHVIQGEASDVSIAHHPTDGYTVLAATVKGTVTIDGDVLDQLGTDDDHDILVVRYDAKGTVSWKRRIGGTGDERAARVALRGSDQIILAVNYTPVPGLGLECDTGVDAGTVHYGALLQLDPTNDGHCDKARDVLYGPGEIHDVAIVPGSLDIWTLAISSTPTLSIGYWSGGVSGGAKLGGGSKPNQEGLAIAAIDDKGFAAGGFTGSLSDYESTAVLQSNGSSDAFVLRFAWNMSEDKVLGDGGIALGDPAFQTFRGASTDGTSLFLIGDIAGSIDLGDGGAIQPAGGTDVIAAKRSPSLDAIWSARFGGEGDEKGTAIAAAGGIVAIGGDHAGGFDLGTPMVGYGKRDAFVAALDATQGTPLWSCSFGGEGDDFVKSVAATSNGDVIAAGTFQGQAAFGSMLDAGANGDAIFIVKLGDGG